jgi:hypothetical protein
VDKYNRLPQSAVNATSTNAFKNHLDKLGVQISYASYPDGHYSDGQLLKNTRKKPKISLKTV